MKKAIVVAYDLNPNLGSECGLAHGWVRSIAKYYDVDVFVPIWHRQGIVGSLAEYPRASFHFISVPRAVQRVLHRLGAWNILNAIFVSIVKRRLAGADLREYALIHVLTPAGVHSFNSLYTVGIPTLVGPLGGALPTPPGFRDVFKDQLLTNAVRDTFYRLIVHLPAWRRYFLNAEMILAGTDSVVDTLPEACRARSRVVFDTSVDVDYFRPANDGRTSAPVVRVLFVGSLTAKKGPVLLIEAARLCRERGVEGIEVVVAGDGPLRHRIHELIADYDLEGSVSLLGQVGRHELLARYQESDIFCLPTLREPGGGAVLEAMACGLPVVTSNYGGPSYSVTDECGIRIEMADSRQYIVDLSLALERLARHEDLRRSMGQRARQRAVGEFSLQALDRNIRDIYRRLMA